MTAKDALIAAILAAPGDDSALLAFADWLEQQSNPLAGCLRLAIRVGAAYGPRHHDHSSSFWRSLGRDIEPGWWGDEARRLAQEVSDKVGDGSKTAILIALALCEGTLLFPEAKTGPSTLGRALPQAVDELTVQARSPAEVGRCMRSAALGDAAIGDTMLSAFAQAGADGTITVTTASPGRSPRARVSTQKGLRFPLSIWGSEDAELQDVAVLVSLRPLQIEEVRRILSGYSSVGNTLLCLCPGLEGPGLEIFHQAAEDGSVMLCDRAQSRWRDCFEDTAVATGAAVIPADSVSPIEITAARFGHAGSVRTEGDSLVIEDPAGPPDGGRAWILHLRQRIDQTSGEEKEWHCLRSAQITGGIMIFEVCGASLQETEELEQLGIGALHAGRATVAHGYVPGGGVAYLRAARASSSPAMRWALEAPSRALLAGTAMDITKTLASLRGDDRLGLDVLDNSLSQWRTEGPVDPTSVVQTVIECASESARRMIARRSPG